MPVAVRIFHPLAPPGSPPLSTWLHAVRSSNARRLADGFAEAGASDVAIVAADGEARPFGARLRRVIAALPDEVGLVILGSGAMPLATRADLGAFVAAAAGRPGTAFTNNRYSADVVAVAGIDRLRPVPDIPTDNVLPRWLAESAGFTVRDARRSWRLAMDLDAPLDALLAGCGPDGASSLPRDLDLRHLFDRLERFRSVSGDAHAELVVAGRTSATSLTWLERATPARWRAVIEERGLRTARSNARRPASLLGMALDQAGPEALGSILARLGEAAAIDTRVLLAHRLGVDDADWPVAEDRFASDLLLPDRISDPWLRRLTAAALDATVPILLGGHSLVGPGLRLVLRRTAH